MAGENLFSCKHSAVRKVQVERLLFSAWTRYRLVTADTAVQVASGVPQRACPAPPHPPALGVLCFTLLLAFFDLEMPLLLLNIFNLSECGGLGHGILL